METKRPSVPSTYHQLEVSAMPELRGSNKSHLLALWCRYPPVMLCQCLKEAQDLPECSTPRVIQLGGY